ncbi:Wzz/FepE/Etk N-terminal domain-containing protein [Bordetella hinzii]|uniref:Wzz/FepE/Etk N-terminal domain-containing protein n=1 Tax=Bordetella hinzii TaxID=103855 RepID=UPI002A18D82D|nr:Wzz/FepE/Etk N-terminal domain-containing protein [Bordetella hinzii]WPL82081.1 Wzz/FepE/Etk N-terminal domain-containing protein [Bordetella hinzii]
MINNIDSFKKKWLFIWVVVVPVVLAAIYYVFFAQDRYVSMAQVVVRQSGRNEAPQVPGLASVLGGLNPVSREETLYLREFLTSQDMLDVLQKELNWSSHYAENIRDPLYWLAKDAPEEDVLRYFRRVVTAHFDEQTGLLAVNVEAFDREFAQKTLRLILAESERFVNEISHRMARDQMAFAQNELINARKAYEERREELIAFQSNNNLLDAEATAKARADVIADLEGNLTKEKARLKALQASLDPNTPQVRQQITHIRAMEQQLAAETQRLVSQKGNDKLNVIASRYRNLTIDAHIAEEAYKFAVGSVETARIEASKKLRSLVTVVTPNLPDKALYPERIYILITLFLGLLLLYGIVRFVIATIQDHRD